MFYRIPGKISRRHILLATLGVCILMLLTGCVMLETYGDQTVMQSERAVVKGYWRYKILFEEELHIESVDGKRDSGKRGWPYAYSVSLPSGRHWLQIVILRNSGEIARCAFEWKFEAQHRYKLKHLHHDQLLLAHPSSLPFAATISIVDTDPSGAAHPVDVSAMCGKQAMCRQNSDCVPQYSCQMNTGFAFGVCQHL